MAYSSLGHELVRGLEDTDSHHLQLDDDALTLGIAPCTVRALNLKTFS